MAPSRTLSLIAVLNGPLPTTLGLRQPEPSRSPAIEAVKPSGLTRHITDMRRCAPTRPYPFVSMTAVGVVARRAIPVYALASTAKAHLPGQGA